MHKIRLSLAALLAALMLLVSPVLAQQTTPGSGLSISPVLSEFEIQPGQSKKHEITLKNITGGDILAQASVNDFSSDNETGNPRIITDPAKRTPNTIRDFVKGLQDVSLAKGEQTKTSVSLEIPAKTPPGAYYGIIRFKAVPTGTDSPKPGDVALTASVGTIVLITVPGNLREQVQLSEIHVYQGDNAGTFFLTKPDKTGIEIKNLGNGFAQPFGTIEVTDTFGKKVHSYQLNNTTPRATILPDSTRIFKNPLQNISKPGRYTVTANVAYGSGSVLVSKKTFWYVPLWLAAVLLAALLVLSAVTYRLYKSGRRGKRRISRR